MKTFLCLLLCLAGFAASSQQLMTIREAFDFEVGDKFHYDQAPSGIPPARDRITILDKYYSLANDSLYYIMFHDSYWSEVSWVPEPHMIYHFYTSIDTVSYTDLDMPLSVYDSNFLCSPTVYQCDTSYEYSAYYCGTLINGWDIVTNDFEPDVVGKTYGKGLGLTAYNFYSGIGQTTIVATHMFYYLKNGSSCGIPDTLTTSTHELGAFQPKLTLYPNPTQGIVMIRTTRTPLLALVTNPEGSIVEQLPVTGNCINIGHLPAGIYLLKLVVDKETVVRKIVKL